MTNEEAIAIIRNEYKCVDRDCNIERSCGKCDLMMPSKEPILEAYKLAIKALEQQLLRELPPVITMRDATPEERKLINDYIKSISTSTGVEFSDAISCDEDCISRQAVLDQTYLWSKDEFLRVTNPFDYLRKRINSLSPVKNTINKIREIVNKWKSDTWTDNLSYECMIKIAELVEPQKRTEE